MGRTVWGGAVASTGSLPDVSESKLPELSPESVAAMGVLPGLPDEAFEHDGLITKRHVRAQAFAFLRPLPGELLWDIGTGSGAMAIEWCRAAPGATAIGVERNPRRAARARRNIERLAPGLVSVVDGEAAENLAALPTPDAVFIGGGVTDGVLDGCWQALAAGGRIVAHGVTLETEALLAGQYRRLGGTLHRIMIDTVDEIGRFLSWSPARPITAWAATKPAD